MALGVAEIMAQAGLGSGGAIACTTLKGGLSHHVLRVEAGGVPYVMRVLDPAVSAAGLGVPARLEIQNTIRAARSGVGPAVLYVIGDTMVLEYIDGVTLSRDDVRRPEMIPRLAAACRRLHEGPMGFAGHFSIFRKAEELFGRCRDTSPYMGTGGSLEDVGGGTSSRRRPGTGAPRRSPTPIPRHNSRRL
jgi:hypothetical protein